MEDLFGDRLRDPDRRFDLEIGSRARHMLRRSGSRPSPGPAPPPGPARPPPRPAPDAAGPGSGQRERNPSGGVAPCIRIWNNQSWS